MTPSSAKTTIILSLGTTVILSILEDAHAKGSRPAIVTRFLAGGGVAIVLTALAQPNPDLAATFALLILVGSLYRDSGAVTSLLGLLGKKK